MLLYVETVIYKVWEDFFTENMLEKYQIAWSPSSIHPKILQNNHQCKLVLRLRRRSGILCLDFTGKKGSLPEVEDIICPCLDGNSWFKLGNKLGFEHNQLTKLQQRYKNDANICSRRMLQIWKTTVNKHTMKYIPLLYRSLQLSGLENLAVNLLRQTGESKLNNDWLLLLKVMLENWQETP